MKVPPKMTFMAQIIAVIIANLIVTGKLSRFQFNVGGKNEKEERGEIGSWKPF